MFTGRRLRVDDRFASNPRRDAESTTATTTARAYWADLDDIYDWCTEAGRGIFALTEPDLLTYTQQLPIRATARTPSGDD